MGLGRKESVQINYGFLDLTIENIAGCNYFNPKSNKCIVFVKDIKDEKDLHTKLFGMMLEWVKYEKLKFVDYDFLYYLVNAILDAYYKKYIFDNEEI
jgi:hypothetical protein